MKTLRLDAWVVTAALTALAAAPATAAPGDGAAAPETKPAPPAPPDEPPLSEFSLRPGVAVGPALELGCGFVKTVTTARLTKAPTFGGSSVLDLSYRRRTELGEGRALLFGGDLDIARGFGAGRRGGTLVPSSACPSGFLRHDESLAVQLNQAGVFFGAEYRQPLGAGWFTDAGAGLGLYRVVATATLRHQEWCALDTPQTTMAFTAYTARQFTYVPGCWVGATLGWRLRDTAPLLEVRVSARVYLVEGFALHLQSDTDPRTVDLHVRPSYGGLSCGLSLRF